jgi:molecular chaperone HscA
MLRLTQGVFEVIATGGDSALGGDDFDQRWPWVLERPRCSPPAKAVQPACGSPRVQGA